MHIGELKEGELELKSGEEKSRAGLDACCRSVAVLDAKRVLVGVGSRALFYPTLLYNIVRNKIESEFRWWDRVDEVQHRHMTPNSAYEHVRSIRPRVLLASSQWRAVQDYFLLKVKESGSSSCMTARKTPDFITKEDTKHDVVASDDSSFVVVTDTDLDGYDVGCESGVVDDKRLAEHSLVCRVQFASQAVISRLSCLWLGCHANQKTSRKKLGSPIGDSQLTSLTVDIQVY